MKFEVIAWVLNTTNFNKEFDSYTKAKECYDKFFERSDCIMVKLNAKAESTLHEADKRLDLYTVEYYDCGFPCQQDFLSREEAEKFIEKYSYKYDNMEIY